MRRRLFGGLNIPAEITLSTIPESIKSTQKPNYRMIKIDSSVTHTTCALVRGILSFLFRSSLFNMLCYSVLMAHVNTSESGRCDRLQRNLLDSVKQCQKRFGCSSEIATETDQEVAYLCQSIEAILSHGLKVIIADDKYSKNIFSVSHSSKCMILT